MRSGEHRIRDDLAVEFDFDASTRTMDAHWHPHPPRKQLTASELALYRTARNKFLREVAAHLGGSVMVIE